MTDGYRQLPPMTRRVAIALPLAVLVATCTPTTVPAPPTTSPAPATPAVTPSPSGEASVVPSSSPLSTPVSSEACSIAPQTGRLASDRMTDVIVSTSDTADLVTFVFGDPSLPAPPQGPSEGSLESAEAPYTQAASGQPIEMVGEHVAQVRFAGMTLSNDVGEPVYDGPFEFRPVLPALRHVVSYDMFEGVVGWYIGYDGPGCVTLRPEGGAVSVVIDHPGP